MYYYCIAKQKNLKLLHKYRTEETLVADLKAKSKDAFNYLYDNYSAALFGVINRIVQSEEIANDILQESFVKIWKNLDFYSREKGSIYTWMLNICRNMAIDTVRSKAYKNETQNQSVEEYVNDIDNSTQVFGKEDFIGLKKVIDKLKPEYLVLINKIYFEGYTHDEVSKEFEIPLGTVKTRIRAAILQLREALKENE
ncbi:MAG: RNA polymerase sigma factor [Bacteroidia bacterium]